MTTPADICNQALDAIGRGADIVIGDIEEGTREAKVLLRAYGQCLRQLLRTANWDFARKTAPLVLLADATGATQNVGNIISAPGWTYEYAYPIDCMRVRFVPFNGLVQPAIPANNIQLSQPIEDPQLISPCLWGPRLISAPFLVATDYNYPPDPSQQYYEVQGVSQQGRTVILSNVKDAVCIYTAFLSAPSVWDSLFRAAFVSYLASEIAIALTVDASGRSDIKTGMMMSDRMIAICKEKIMKARIADGNEGIASTDHLPDFMRLRISGNGLEGGHWSNQAGVLYGGGCGGDGGFDSIFFCNGSVY